MNDINALMEILRSAEVGVGTLIVIIVLVLIVTIVLCLPMVFVLRSKRVSGSTKVTWFILTSIFSWLAYPAFLALTRKKADADPQSGKASG